MAGPNTTRVVAYEVARYIGPASQPAPNFPRGKLLGVVELADGRTLTAPIVQGRVKGAARTASAVFEPFELDQVAFFGVKEAETGSYPAIAEFNGIKVTAFPQSGARLVIRRLGNVHPDRSMIRNGYRAFPRMGSAEAIPPVTKIVTAVTFGDGMHSASAMFLEFESTAGLSAMYHFNGAGDNATTSAEGLLPIEIREGSLHRLVLHFERGHQPSVFDDCVVKRISVSGGDPDLPLVPLFDSGAIDVFFGVKDKWMSPMLAKRRLSNVLRVRNLQYEILTGDDDLRSDTNEIRTSSRLILTASGTKADGSAVSTSATLPSEMDIRRGAFTKWSTFSAGLDFGEAIPLARIRGVSLESILGAGSGDVFGLRPDTWSFDGVRVFCQDSGGVRRIIYSDYERRVVNRNTTYQFVFSEQNDYVTDRVDPSALRRMGIALPGIRPPSP